MKSVAALLTATFVVAATSCDSERPEVRGVSSGAAPGSVAITRLQTRDHIITLSAGNSEVLYTISTLSGTVLVRDVPKTVLALKHPEVYDSVRGAIAEDSEAPWVGNWNSEF